LPAVVTGCRTPALRTPVCTVEVTSPNRCIRAWRVSQRGHPSPLPLTAGQAPARPSVRQTPSAQPRELCDVRALPPTQQLRRPVRTTHPTDDGGWEVKLSPPALREAILSISSITHRLCPLRWSRNRRCCCPFTVLPPASAARPAGPGMQARRGSHVHHRAQHDLTPRTPNPLISPPSRNHVSRRVKPGVTRHHLFQPCPRQGSTW
jgi:hypothetical protein